MQRFDVRIVFGILLILSGVLFLAQTLGLLPANLGWVWTIVFGVAGASFMYVFLRERFRWWAVIPGLGLLGLALLTALALAAPTMAGSWGAAFFFGALGTSFLLIYLMRHDFWWALIPCGSIWTLGAVALSTLLVKGEESGALLFLGLGATFAVVGLVPTTRGRMTWAFIPAGILAGMGILVALAMGSVLNYVWPIALIGAGIYILLRNFVFNRAV